MEKTKPTDVKEALKKAKKLCSGREKCTSEIRHKLKEWSLSSEQFDAVITLLIKEGYIDETRYANAFVNDKFRFNKWGKKKIEYALKEKSIPGEIIHSALGRIDDKDYLGVLKKEIKSKLKNVSAKNKYELMGKLLKFAQGKGFETNLSLRVIEELIKS
ncbi:MAG: RecX family transcriptional regulator [Bacteroidia bacterium]|nr:RecX family transcriptional regulator [Bacteroidia bacterium]